jgi:hypothetical protein
MLQSVEQNRIKSQRTKILEALESSLKIYEMLVEERGYLLGKGLSDEMTTQHKESGYRQIELTLKAFREYKSCNDTNIRLFIPGNNNGVAYAVFKKHDVLKLSSLMRNNSDEVLSSLEQDLEQRGYYLPAAIRAFRLSIMSTSDLIEA